MPRGQGAKGLAGAAKKRDRIALGLISFRKTSIEDRLSTSVSLLREPIIPFPCLMCSF